MARMVAIGPEHLTLPFGALGFERVAASPSSFIEVLRPLAADRSVGLIVCGESCTTESAMAAFREIRAASHATLLVVPDGPRPRGVGLELIRRSIEQAAGVDLLSATAAEESDQSPVTSDRTSEQ